MKCDICGVESAFDSGFKKERRSFRRSNRTMCPTCWVKRGQASGRWFLWGMLAAGAVGSVILCLDPASELGHFLFFIFLFDLFLILTIIPHELGHAVVARLMGWRVFRIVIGIGKPVFRRSFLGFLFEFRLLPIGGLTLTTPIDWRWFRLKRFLMILAGPLVNAVLAIAVVLVWQGSLLNFDFWALPLVPRIFLWANAWVFIVNMWPHQPKTGYNVPSDGKQLLNVLSFTKEALAAAGSMRFSLEAMQCRENADYNGARDWCDQGLALFPENFTLLNLSGINYMDQQLYAEAREIFLKLLARENKPGVKRYLALNNVAYASALTQNPHLLQEADAYSKEACIGLGWVASIVGTRGTVLVAMGNYEEGIKLLKESLENAENALSKAENSCHLVIAFARQGMLDEAQKYLQLARQLNDKCRLITSAEREVEGSRPGAEMKNGG